MPLSSKLENSLRVFSTQWIWVGLMQNSFQMGLKCCFVTCKRTATSASSSIRKYLPSRSFSSHRIWSSSRAKHLSALQSMSTGSSCVCVLRFCSLWATIISTSRIFQIAKASKSIFWNYRRSLPTVTWTRLTSTLPPSRSSSTNTGKWRQGGSESAWLTSTQLGTECTSN